MFEYLVLVPVIPVEPVPGTEPHESLCVLNNRINSDLRQILRVGQLSKPDVPASNYRYSNDVLSRGRSLLGATMIWQSESRAQETNPSEAKEGGVRGPAQHRGKNIVHRDQKVIRKTGSAVQKCFADLGPQKAPLASSHQRGLQSPGVRPIACASSAVARRYPKLACNRSAWDL